MKSARCCGVRNAITGCRKCAPFAIAYPAAPRRRRRGAGGGGAWLGSGAVAPDESLDFDLAAAGLRAEGGDALRLVEVLAVKLEDALPGRAAVERRGVRLLSKQKRVERIDVELGDATYQLISDGRKVTGMRGQAVR